MRRFGPISAAILGLATLAPIPARSADRGPSKGEYGPDPASVQRQGKGYRYPQSGWIVLHIEGEPYERGYQHGSLLAPEIADYLKTLSAKRSPKENPAEAWQARSGRSSNALFLRRYDKRVPGGNERDRRRGRRRRRDVRRPAGRPPRRRRDQLRDRGRLPRRTPSTPPPKGLEGKDLQGARRRRPPQGPPRADHCSGLRRRRAPPRATARSSSATSRCGTT